MSSLIAILWTIIIVLAAPIAGLLARRPLTARQKPLLIGIQDTIGILRAFVLGILLLIPVVVTGSLLPSIVAHTIVDAFSGLYGRIATASLQPK